MANFGQINSSAAVVSLVKMPTRNHDARRRCIASIGCGHCRLPDFVSVCLFCSSGQSRKQATCRRHYGRGGRLQAGRFAEALAKAKEADAIPGKPAELSRQIHQMIVAYAMQAKDYPSACAAMEKMIAAGEVTPQRIKELPCGREPR